MRTQWMDGHVEETPYLSSEEAYAVVAVEETPAQRLQEAHATDLFRLYHKARDISHIPR